MSPLPDRPDPLIAQSWNIAFPRFRPFGTRHTVVLNKLYQACPGLGQAVAERIYGALALPVSHARWVRLEVNGGTYHYMLDVEHPDEDMMKRLNPPKEPMGDLFKATGVIPNTDHGNEGPYGVADERKLALNPSCPQWSVADRYAYTYERKTNKWKGPQEVQSLIEDLAAARISSHAFNGWAPLRAFFERSFDLQALTDYMALRSWSAPWDDMIHNHLLYRRANGKWILIPWDVDEEFGEFRGWNATSSFFIGEYGDKDNRYGWASTLKDSFIKAYRQELAARIVELSRDHLSPENIMRVIDEAAAGFDLTEIQRSPAGASSCDFAGELDAMRRFAEQRHAQVSKLEALR